MLIYSDYMTFDIESSYFIGSFIWRFYVLDSGQAY